MEARPLFNRILVRRLEADAATEHGIIIPDQAKEKPLEGVVVAKGKCVSELELGNRVLFSKYAGTEATIEGELFLILCEEDCLVVLPELEEVPEPAEDNEDAS